MGSSSKKHKRDRDSKKHKRKSRSPSLDHSPDNYSRSRDKSQSASRKHHHKHHSKTRSRSRTPIKISVEFRGRDRENTKRYVHHKKRKEHKRKREQPHSEDLIHEIYHSDSSDVIEVPLAPPAPIISNAKERTPSPIPENGAGDCLSIEETNKLRAKLGLKPLEVESSISITTDKANEEGLNSFKDEWGEFLHKPADNIAEKKEAEKLREKLKQRKEKRAVEEKLKKVLTLGESDEEVDDIKKWVERSKKKDDIRKEAERRAKMLEEMDAEFSVGNLVDQDLRNARRNAYKDRDLKGLRVEHDVAEFTEGRSMILTLRDKEVLADEDDTLVNVNLIDEARYKKNVENRKQKPNTYGYSAYEESIDEFEQIAGRSILGKYDDEIEGDSKKKSFVIGENLEEEREHKRRLLEIKSKLSGKKLETLNDQIIHLASDTYTVAELEKFKKPKKKVKKVRQKLKAEDLLPLASNNDNFRRGSGNRSGRKLIGLETDDVPRMHEDLSNVKLELEDENDLERALNKARKLKQKELVIRKDLQIDTEKLKEEIKSEPESDSDMKEDGHIVLNSTAEFCRTLGDIPTYGMAGNRDEDSNDIMDFEDKPANLEPPIVADEPSTGTWNSVNPDAFRLGTDEFSNDVSEIAILDEEPDVGTGVAAALRLAVSKGYLEKEDKNRPSNSRMAHLQAKNYSIEDKSYNEDDKFGRRDRYHSGPIMEFKERDLFKPNVKLEYIDDNGRVLNAKEAFRYLSHKFHGKGPGKNKIEKRLKKSEQEGLMMKMSSTDTPLGTLNMLQQKQKETQSPFVVLSGSKHTHTSTSIAKQK